MTLGKYVLMKHKRCIPLEGIKLAHIGVARYPTTGMPRCMARATVHKFWLKPRHSIGNVRIGASCLKFTNYLLYVMSTKTTSNS